MNGHPAQQVSECLAKMRISRQPRLKFQEYWRLVRTQPDGPRETYHCSYLVDWVNITGLRFRGIVDSTSAFEKTRLAWNQSKTCRLLQSKLEGLFAAKKVTKIICLGLGDMCREPPEWCKRQTSSDGGHDPDEVWAELRYGNSMLQHSMALTIAQACRNSNAGHEVRLLAQDPAYTDKAKEILKDSGFELVGEFGAGGFAEIDDDSVVFSAHINAPLKQIIADLARPPLIISTSFSEVFNDSGYGTYSSLPTWAASF